MIRLVKDTGIELWVNPFNISFLEKTIKGGSCIYLKCGSNFLVKESPEEVALYVRKFYEGRLINE
jgi:uncharacterized protein YlzI (FlbEa/FlbD family)